MVIEASGARFLVHDGIVDRVPIEHCGIRSQDLPVELRAEYGVLELLRMIIPVPDKDVLPIGGVDESQDPCQQFGIC